MNEFGGEKSSEFLLRMCNHPYLKPMDKQKMRAAAMLFISHIEQIERLRDENERLVRRIENPAAANEEIPF